LCGDCPQPVRASLRRFRRRDDRDAVYPSIVARLWWSRLDGIDEFYVVNSRGIVTPYCDLDTCVTNTRPIAIEQAEMEAALSRPDRFEQE
jgi:hypothetical protein